MKTKLLSYTIASLMAGHSSSSWSVQALSSDLSKQPDETLMHQNDEHHPAIACETDQCEDQGQMLFRLHSYASEQPATTGLSKHSSAEALAPDRRATISLSQPEQLQQAQINANVYQTLPYGGVLWATEDPVPGRAELTVSAPSMLAFKDGKIVEPVTFYSRNNYFAFIDKMEILLYRQNDVDFVQPIATLPMRLGGVVETAWDGQLSAENQYREGDRLIYIVRAYDKNGDWDETYPAQIQLVSPQEAQRNNTLLNERLQRQLNQSLGAEDALKQRMINDVFSANGLRQQNIAFNGSRVIIQGRNIASNSQLYINDQLYPIDREGKFAAEYLMPVGHHQFNLKVAQQQDVTEKTLSVDVTGQYFFGMAIADLTLQQNKIKASNERLSNYGGDDLFTDARLALYFKTKLKSKYLITGQADTTEKEIGQLFNGFTDSYPKDVFRRLDPAQYYPSYGDDSTTTRDIDTQGRMYLRLDWDKNHAVWGNYFTAFSDTALAQYQRALYGGNLDWRSQRYTQFGDEKSKLQVFGSNANTAQGRTELLGTGGSLYYLRHTDILPGSDQVSLEVRDKVTGRVISSQVLVSGTDYEINAYQGRIQTRLPLSQLAGELTNSISTETPLEGYEQRLIVDYEYAPKGLEEQLTQGLRLKHWLTDFVGLGATYVTQENAGDDYNLKAVDLELKAGRGTYLKVEHGQSESASAPIFYSDNGGLSFIQINRNVPRNGKASSVEARVNFYEQGWSKNEWTAGAWWKTLDAGYSSSRTNTQGFDITEYGAEVAGELSSDLQLYAKHSSAERGQESLTQNQLTAAWRWFEDKTITAEVKNIDENRLSGKGSGTLAALKYSQKLNPFLELYTVGQITLENEGGYQKNNAITLGGRYMFNDRSTLTASATQGDRGNAATLSAEYQLKPEHSLYGAYTLSTEDAGYDAMFNPSNPAGWTLGQRWRISNQSNLYNESQYLKDRRLGNALMHTFGMDFYPRDQWSVGYALQSGTLESTTGDVKRKAISVYGGQSSNASNWQSKIEWREDSGSESRTQWVSTNTLRHKINESWRIAAKANFSQTKDHLNRQADAKFADSSVGFAYRPWNSSRWGLFGRYSYIYDLSSLGQVGTDENSMTSAAYYNQKAHVSSLEGVYRWTHRFESAIKLADRVAKVKMARDQGAWFDSNMFFTAIQGRYEVRDQWYAMAEYRWLNVEDGGNKQGMLVGVDKDINQNFRVGVGYNFTDFSSDLTRVDNFKNRGWFLNFVGYY